MKNFFTQWPRISIKTRATAILIPLFWGCQAFAQEPVATPATGAAPAPVIHLHEFIKDENWISTYLWVQDVNNKNGTFNQEKSRKGIIKATSLLKAPGNTPVMKLLAQDLLAIGYLKLVVNLSKVTDETALRKWMNAFIDNWEKTKNGGLLTGGLLAEKNDFDQEEGVFKKLLDTFVGLDFLDKGSKAEKTKDYLTALNLYHEAADHGCLDAYSNIGNFYWKGLGVPQDSKEAMKWYQKGAEQGDANAEYLVGALYAVGKGVTQDYKEAMAWDLKSASQGNADSECNIGALYCNGQGVAKDYLEAMKWFVKAVDQGNGHGDGEFNIGILYENGDGVKQDYQSALKWYKKAAAKGNPEAAQNLMALKQKIKEGINSSFSGSEEDGSDFYSPVSAEKLYSDYQDNEVAADQKYKGKKLEIKGHIDSINKDAFGNPFIQLRGSGEYSSVEVDARYSDKDIEWLSKLHKGQILKVKGTCSGMVLGTPQIDAE